MIAGVDFDTFGVYIALVDFEGELVEVITLRYRDKTREAEASHAFPAALRIPKAVEGALGLKTRRLPALAFVEHGFAPKGQMRHVFSMGRVQGLVVAALLELGVSVQECTPAQWRKALGVPGNCSKAEAHARLRELFPEPARDGRLADENVRDALAIAYAGARRNAEDLRILEDRRRA